MDLFLSWWQHTGKKEKFIQVLAFFLVFGCSLELSGSLFGAPMGLAGFYIVYDCIKRKSLAGFYLPVRYWLPLAAFLGSVVLASVILGDKPSINIAFQYVYWCLPFIVVTYLGKQANIKYAILFGALLSLLLSAGNMVYYLYSHGYSMFSNVRIGAFSRISNTQAVLTLGVLPILFCAFRDRMLRERKIFFALLLGIAVLGFWSLWETGSRGAMLGFCLGALFVTAAVRFRPHMWKSVLTVLLAGAVLVSGYAFFGIIPGGKHGSDDEVRLRMVKYSYYLWQDHKLYGVGLANWVNRYVARFGNGVQIRKPDQQLNTTNKKSTNVKKAPQKAQKPNTANKKSTNIKKAPQKVQKPNTADKKSTNVKKAPQKAQKKKTENKKSANIKKAQARKKARINKEYAISTVIRHKVPHNSIAWFFTTTGVIGGIGYVVFVLGYLNQFLQKIKRYPEEWILLAVFWVFAAIGIHGLLDVGITYKAAARLLYILLGAAMSAAYVCEAEKPGAGE